MSYGARDDLFEVDRSRGLASASGADGLEGQRILVALTGFRLVLALNVKAREDQGSGDLTVVNRVGDDVQEVADIVERLESASIAAQPRLRRQRGLRRPLILPRLRLLPSAPRAANRWQLRRLTPSRAH
jgi:hypothetical protein